MASRSRSFWPFLWFFLSKKKFQIHIIVTALAALIDIAFDWYSLYTFVKRRLYLFSAGSAIVLAGAPLLAMLGGACDTHPLLHLIQLHLVRAAMNSLWTGRQELALVWAVICEVKLEAYLQNYLQALSVIFCPMVDDIMSLYLARASVLYGLFNAGKVLALQVDFHGSTTRLRPVGERVSAFVWDDWQKSKEPVEAEIVDVKDYGYVLGEITTLYSKDAKSILDVELKGGDGHPLVIGDHPNHFAAPKVRAGARLWRLQEIKITRSGTDLVINEHLAKALMFKSVAEVRALILQLSNIAESRNDRKVCAHLCSMHEVPHEWVDDQLADLKQLASVSSCRLFMRCVFRISEVTHVILLTALLTFMWCEYAGVAQMSAHFIIAVAVLVLVLFLDGLLLYLFCARVAMIEYNPYRLICAALLFVSGPPLMLTKFLPAQCYYYALRSLTSLALLIALAARWGSFVALLEHVWIAEPILSSAWLLASGIFFTLLPFELCCMREKTSSSSAYIGLKHEDPYDVEAEPVSSSFHPEIDDAPSLQAAVDRDEAWAVRFLGHVQLVSDQRTLVHRALVNHRCKALEVLTGIYNRREKLFQHAEGVTGVAAFRDGRRLLTVSRDKTGAIWDLANSQKPIVQLIGHSGWLEESDVFPDDTRVVTGSTDRSVRIWDATSGKEIQRLEGHKETVRSVRAFPDGRRVLSSSFDCTSCVWDATIGTLLCKVSHNDRVLVGTVFPDGRRVLSACRDGVALLWDADDGKIQAKLGGHKNGAEACAAFADNIHVLTSAGDGAVTLWRAHCAEVVRRFCGHSKRVLALAVLPDQAHFLSAGEDATARFWCVRDGSEVGSVQFSSAVYSISCTPDGLLGIAACVDGFASVWELLKSEIELKLGNIDNRTELAAKTLLLKGTLKTGKSSRDLIKSR